MWGVCARGACSQTGAAGYYNRVAKLVLQGVLFENNTAQAGAGALEMNLCNGDVQTCVFAKNKARTLAHHPQEVVLLCALRQAGCLSRRGRMRWLLPDTTSVVLLLAKLGSCGVARAARAQG